MTTRAALDLLLDEECAIWHLANVGAVSGFDFAQLAAAACGGRTELVQPARTCDIWSPARRPAYSALASARSTVMPPLADALAALADALAASPDHGVESCVSP